MSAVQGAEPWLCTLARADVAQTLLPQLLPGLRSGSRFSYLAQRLAAAAATSSVGRREAGLGAPEQSGTASVINLAQFIDLFGSLGAVATLEQRATVAFRAFDLDEDGLLGPAKVGR